MSIKQKLFTAIVSAFVIIGFTTFVSAQEATTETQKQEKQEKSKWRGDKFGKKDGFRKGFRGGKRGGILGELRGIELTDVQKEQIRSIMEANRPDPATMEEMRTLMKAKRDGTITAEQEERFRFLKNQTFEKSQLVRQQVLAILTPEQRQQIEQKKEEMRQKWEQRRQLRQQKQPTEKNN
jgi:Spy/CpxP family protein refolding chaperone